MPEPRRYRFGPLEPGGALGSIGWGQLAWSAGGVVAGILVLRLRGDAAGGLAGLVLAVVALVLALVPLGGRSVQGWAPVLGGFLARRLGSRARFRSPAPLAGVADLEALPASLEGVRLLEVPVLGGSVGVARDGNVYSACLAVGGGPFALLDRAEQERRVAAFGDVLGALGRAGSPVWRLQWLERTAPGPVDELGRHLAEGLALPAAHASVASYLELVDRAAPLACRHELLLVLAVDARRAGRAVRRAGGGETGACALLVRELTALAGRLHTAEVAVEGTLSARLLARAIRLGFEPEARGGLERGGAGAEDPGLEPAQAGPLAAEEGWGTYRSDGALHATYWVAEWPRSEVGCDFLAPLLLLGSGPRRTVGVTMQPLDPARALRAAEAARTDQASDEEMRERLGFVATHRRRRRAEATERREAEMAGGHAAYRFSGYVTVSAGGPGELEAACAEVEASAQMARLELRRLWGEQQAAFTYTLPLARGLR